MRKQSCRQQDSALCLESPALDWLGWELLWNKWVDQNWVSWMPTTYGGKDSGSHTWCKDRLSVSHICFMYDEDDGLDIRRSQMWKTAPDVGTVREEVRATVPFPPSLCVPAHPGGHQATHTALLRLFESTSPLTIYTPQMLFEVNPLRSSDCFTTGVDREQTAGRRLWGQLLLLGGAC